MCCNNFTILTFILLCTYSLSSLHLFWCVSHNGICHAAILSSKSTVFYVERLVVVKSEYVVVLQVLAHYC